MPKIATSSLPATLPSQPTPKRRSERLKNASPYSGNCKLKIHKQTSSIESTASTGENLGEVADDNLIPLKNEISPSPLSSNQFFVPKSPTDPKTNPTSISLETFETTNYETILTHFRTCDEKLYRFIQYYHSGNSASSQPLTPPFINCPVFSVEPQSQSRQLLKEDSIEDLKKELGEDVKVEAIQPPSYNEMFTSLAKSIVFQQLHGKAATTIWNRLVEGVFTSAAPNLKLPPDNFQLPRHDPKTPEIHPTTQTILTPTMFHAFSIEQLKPFGLSGQKASYLISLSQFFSLPSTMTLLSPTSLSTLSNDEIKRELIKVKGIGSWTVDMFLMFCLKRLDVFPVGDLGVKKGMSLFFGCEEGWWELANQKGIKSVSEPNLNEVGMTEGKGKNRSSPKKKKSTVKMKLISDSEMYERTEHWKPFRSVGSWYMWRLIEIEDSK